MIAALVAAVAGLSFFFVVDALRSRTESQQTMELKPDWGRAQSTALGYLAVFSRWTTSSEGPEAFHLSLGAYTFGGVLETVGLHNRQLGVYANSLTLEGGDQSNIYTAFRGLIEDFSLPGAAAGLLLTGFFGGYVYGRPRLSPSVKCTMLAAFYGFVLWSPIGSLFVYNGPILALLLAYLVLQRASKRLNDPWFAAATAAQP